MRFSKTQWDSAEKKGMLDDYRNKLYVAYYQDNPKNKPKSRQRSEKGISIDNVRLSIAEDMVDSGRVVGKNYEDQIDKALVYLPKSSVTQAVKKYKDKAIEDLASSTNNYPITMSEIPNNIRPYCQAIMDIEEMMNFAPGVRDKLLIDNLTTDYKVALERCFYGFNDPTGEKVDLLAQWSVVNEYSTRIILDLDVDDIDGYFGLRPWEDGGKTYELITRRNTSRRLKIDNLLEEEMDSPVGDAWKYLGFRKYIDIHMIINAELRLPWYVSQENNNVSRRETYEQFIDSLNYAFKLVDMLRVGFPSEMDAVDEANIFQEIMDNDENFFTYFTMEEIIDFYRSKGGWRGCYARWIQNEELIDFDFYNDDYDRYEHMKLTQALLIEFYKRDEERRQAEDIGNIKSDVEIIMPSEEDY